MPYVPLKDCFSSRQIQSNIHLVYLNYGFMDVVNIPKALEASMHLNSKNIIYLVENTHLITTKANLTFYWQEKLFAF